MMNIVSKSGKKQPNPTNKDRFARDDRTEEPEEDNLPPGFYHAEPILQDLYERRRINDSEFIHYNRFNPRDLGQILIDDRVCSERDLPMDLRRYLDDND